MTKNIAIKDTDIPNKIDIMENSSSKIVELQQQKFRKIDQGIVNVLDTENGLYLEALYRTYPEMGDRIDFVYDFGIASEKPIPFAGTEKDDQIYLSFADTVIQANLFLCENILELLDREIDPIPTGHETNISEKYETIKIGFDRFVELQSNILDIAIDKRLWEMKDREANLINEHLKGRKDGITLSNKLDIVISEITGNGPDSLISEGGALLYDACLDGAIEVYDKIVHKFDSKLKNE